MPLLQVENLKKVYSDGYHALRGINFTVQPGEFVVVIGPSGAGKSTLLRCINRLVEASSGAITFKGTNVTKARKRQVQYLRREIGMIFQGYNLVQRVSVLQNVLHGRLGYMNPWLAGLGLYSKTDKEEAFQILGRLGMSEQMYKRADELSGGQQQRVGIARTLAQKPQLILADEPIASLDPATSETIMNYLYSICKEDGIACICSLHQVDLAKKYATTIIGIHKGEVVFQGPPDQLTDEIIELIYTNKEKGLSKWSKIS